MSKINFSKSASRFLALFLALVMLLSFAACDKDDKNPVDTDEETEGNDETKQDDGIVSNVPKTLTFNNQEVRLWVSPSEMTKSADSYSGSSVCFRIQTCF